MIVDPVGHIQLTTSVIAASNYVKVIGRRSAFELIRHKVHFQIKPNGSTPLSALTFVLQGSPVANDNGPWISPGFAIGTTNTNFSNVAFQFKIDGVNKAIDANAAGSPFSAAHQIAAGEFLAIGIFIDIAGAITTKIPGLLQSSNTSYGTSKEAVDALLDNSFVPPLNTTRIGILVLDNNGTLWTANTNNLAGDLDAIRYISETSPFIQSGVQYDFDAPDRTLGKGVVYFEPDENDNYMRIVVTAMTGNDEVIFNDEFVPVNYD